MSKGRETRVYEAEPCTHRERRGECVPQFAVVRQTAGHLVTLVAIQLDAFVALLCLPQPAARDECVLKLFCKFVNVNFISHSLFNLCIKVITWL